GAPPTRASAPVSLHDALPISAAEGTEAPMRCERERRAVVDAARTLVAEGLVVGTAGNVSLRAGDGEDALVAVTPSGLDYAAMTPDRKSTRLNSSHVKISYAVF